MPSGLYARYWDGGVRKVEHLADMTVYHYNTARDIFMAWYQTRTHLALIDVIVLTGVPYHYIPLNASYATDGSLFR